MPRLPLFPALLAVALAAPMARADALPDVAAPYVTQLSDQGYGTITVGTTWLGRIVITATRDGIAREIVLNRRTGALLGDSATLPAAAARPEGAPDRAPAATAADVAVAGDMPDAGDAQVRAFGDERKAAP